MKEQNQTPVSYVGKHTFSAAEKEQKLQQMLASMRQKEEIEAEMKTSQSTYKARINAKDGEIKLTANLLNTGFEDRTFTCILTKNFDTLEREYREINTGLLVGTEPLTAGDHQMQLKLTEEAIKEQNADQLQTVIEEKVESAGLTVVRDDEPVVLTEEEIAQAEAGPDPQPEYIVEPDSNPIEFEPPSEKGGIQETDEFLFDNDESDDDEDPFNF
jgi:hypothetical protein